MILNVFGVKGKILSILLLNFYFKTKRFCYLIFPYIYSGPSEYTEILKTSNGKLFIWIGNMENNLILLIKSVQI